MNRNVVDHQPDMIKFQYFSPSNEGGFPGSVLINVTYRITSENSWRLEYRASADSPTILSMTNHAYFNLNANVNNTPTVLETVVEMPSASSFVQVDGNLLPTGKILPTAGTVLNFMEPKAIGSEIPLKGYDNAWIFDNGVKPAKPRDVVKVHRYIVSLCLRQSELSCSAHSKTFKIFISPETGILLTMRTDQVPKNC